MNPFDGQWAIRRAFRKVIDKDAAHAWAHFLAILLTLIITGIMIGFALWRIRQEMRISPSVN